MIYWIYALLFTFSIATLVIAKISLNHKQILSVDEDVAVYSCPKFVDFWDDEDDDEEEEDDDDEFEEEFDELDDIEEFN